MKHAAPILSTIVVAIIVLPLVLHRREKAEPPLEPWFELEQIVTGLRAKGFSNIAVEFRYRGDLYGRETDATNIVMPAPIQLKGPVWLSYTQQTLTESEASALAKAHRTNRAFPGVFSHAPDTNRFPILDTHGGTD